MSSGATRFQLSDRLIRQHTNIYREIQNLDIEALAWYAGLNWVKVGLRLGYDHFQNHCQN